MVALGLAPCMRMMGRGLIRASVAMPEHRVCAFFVDSLSVLPTAADNNSCFWVVHDITSLNTDSSRALRLKVSSDAPLVLHNGPKSGH